MSDHDTDDGWWGVDEIIKGKTKKPEGFNIEDFFKKPTKTTDEGIIELPRGRPLDPKKDKND